ncbi:MAG: glutamyl-tRNA reductase [Caldilineaceae bacterium]
MLQIDRLICIGLSHQTAPVELRERLSQWSATDIRNRSLQELIILSTCNRLELYAYVAADVKDPRQALIELAAAQQNLSPHTFIDHLYSYQGAAVAHHLCRVATGLESLVLGEAQILGQVNSAWQHAQHLGMVGPVLNLLLRTAIKTGKQARTVTKISANPVSISSVALNLAQQVTGALAQQQVLLIGLGEIGQLALKGLRARGVSHLSLANRTVQRAQHLAATWGGQAYALSELPQALQQADVVISATSAIEPLLSAALVADVMATRPHKPLTLLDLAVPRDIEPAAGAVPGVTLFDVDDLQNSVDAALAARQREVPQVEALIEEALATWAHELYELRLRPVVVELRQKAEEIRQRTVARALHHLGEVDEQTTDQLHRLSRTLVNQLLHEPTLQLKRYAGQQEADVYAAVVCDLFGLDSSDFSVSPTAGANLMSLAPTPLARSQS